jgi:hypothetical protein
MYSTLSRYARNPLWAIFCISILVGLLTALVAAAIVNIKPYVFLVSWVLNQSSWLQGIPWLAYLMSRLNIGIEYVAAAFIWFVVQACQCIWILVGLDVVANTNAMKQSAEIKRELVAAGQTVDSQSLAEIPFFFVKWAKMLAIAAYTADLIIGCREYPVWSSWSTFMMWIRSFNPIWINGGNIINLLSMLFLFEGVLILTIAVWQWVTIRKA